MSTLVELWNFTYEKGYKVRKNKKDGLAEWQPLKKKYGELAKDTKFPVNDAIKELSDKYFKVGEDTTDLQDSKFEYNDNTLNNKIDTHHFFIQHFRIPYLEKHNLSVLKFLQIAYNAGQLKASFEDGDYDDIPDMKEFYHEHKLDQPDTFINEKHLNMQIGGRNYKYKYQKYKSMNVE
jgi:hypothetical protein